MEKIELARLFLLFLSYSFLGWSCEVIYCSIPAKHFINRGFLHGPLCPVYGFGGILVIFLLEPWSKTWLLLFFMSMLITTALEYFTSWIMEKLFSTKWWDYSKHKFNINGRVCLLNSLLFGVLGLLAVHFVHPFVFGLIMKIPEAYIKYIAIGFFVVFAFDLLITIKHLVEFNEHLARLAEFGEALKEKFIQEAWFKAGSVYDMFALVKAKAQEKQQELNTLLNDKIQETSILKNDISQYILDKIDSFSKRKKSFERIVKSFPSMSSKRFGMQIDQIKKLIETKKK